MRSWSAIRRKSAREADCGSEINSEAAGADGDRSAKELEATLGPLMAHEGEAMLQGEAD